MVEFHPEADIELREAILWVEAAREGYGFLLADDVQERLAHAELWPDAGFVVHRSRRRGQVRRLVLSRFPYAIYYVPTQDLIFVVAFAHAGRRPGYWRRRVH